MNNKNILIVSSLFFLGIVGTLFWNRSSSVNKSAQIQTTLSKKTSPKSDPPAHPLSIEFMRSKTYPGSDLTTESILESGSNYTRAIVSYKSEGLKIFALLTIPQGQKPKNGWPVIIFNHGYIPPEQYQTTERYLAYTDAFSRNGYIVLKSDYRGHGDSEGKPEGAYYSSAYTVDILNAVSSIKKYKNADPNNIGMWGHSMGGMITLRTMVTTKDIKAADIWGGVTASYEDLANNWRHPDLNPRPFVPSQREQASGRPGRQSLISKYGGFSENPAFWKSISPISFVRDISGPLQLQHGANDDEVPLLFSNRLNAALKEAQKSVTFYVYEGDDHNLSINLNTALDRSVAFFDSYLKK